MVIAAAAVIAAVVLGASGRAGLGPRPRFTATDNPRPPPDALAVTPGPWPSGNSDVAPRLQAIGLPALSAEGEVVHTHQHLDIVVNGQHLPVHTQVGIDPLGRFLSPLHTHDATGILHLEATDTAAYTLGQFFDVWGVRFDATCLGVYCADAGHQLRVVANGHPVEGDPRRLTLTSTFFTAPPPPCLPTRRPAIASPPGSDPDRRTHPAPGPRPPHSCRSGDGAGFRSNFGGCRDRVHPAVNVPPPPPPVVSKIVITRAEPRQASYR
ncbi:MAG: hypothetical protein E6G27_02160 [Actinobacteria bacterium]|nr:MAG: hypothetical protein E6G27_02160 [Actinomycetota bacterium]